MPRIETEEIDNVPWKEPVTVPPFERLIASWASRYRHLIMAYGDCNHPAARTVPPLSRQRVPTPSREGGAVFAHPFYADPENEFDAAGQPHPYRDYRLKMRERRSIAG